MVESTELVGAGQVADTEVVALDGSTAEDLPAGPVADITPPDAQHLISWAP